MIRRRITGLFAGTPRAETPKIINYSFLNPIRHLITLTPSILSLIKCIIIDIRISIIKGVKVRGVNQGLIGAFGSVKTLMKGQPAGNQMGSSETIRPALEDNLYWAIGLFEAEGTLITSGGRIYISLCQSTKNIKVLHRVKSIMGLGVVKTRKDGRYSD